MTKNFIVVFPEIGKGGAERVVATIANNLAHKNYLVTIISLGPEHDYSFLNFSDKIEIFHFPRKSRLDFSSFLAISDILKKRKANFVFCVDFFSQLFLSLLRRFYNFNFNIVLNVHITIPIKKKDYLINWWGARFLKKDDWVIFISKNQQEYLKSRFLLASSCHKKIIFNGIDTKIFQIASTKERFELRESLLNISGDSPVIIKVAGIRIEKDHEVAIRALKYFHDTFSHKPFFVILGDGNQLLTNQLKKLVEELELTNYVRFVGFNTNVNKFLACADLFTLTSHSVETFSLAALEAMACGLPAVLTNIGGADEMIIEGVNGYLCKVKDPENIALKWRLALETNFNGDEIRDIVAKMFDVNKMTSDYHVLFDEIDLTHKGN